MSSIWLNYHLLPKGDDELAVRVSAWIVAEAALIRFFAIGGKFQRWRAPTHLGPVLSTS